MLLPTLFFIVAIALVAYAVHSRAQLTYYTAQRSEYRARASVVAQSELEYIYFQIKTLIVEKGYSPEDVPQKLYDTFLAAKRADGSAANLAIDIPSSPSTPGGTANPTTEGDPFSDSHKKAMEGWKVRRSITYDTPATGIIPGTTKTGHSNYFTVKVEVYSTEGPIKGLGVRLGRRMTTSKSSMLDRDLFSQGDLEFAPGGDVVIDGDIVANGNIYIGARSGGSMQINAYVRYLAGKSFNPGKLPSGTTIQEPTWGTSQTAQVSTLTEPDNFIGGLDATDLALKYGADYASNTDYNGLFGEIKSNPSTDTALFESELKRAENLVYRSVIAPPPSAVYDAIASGKNDVDSYKGEYPDVVGLTQLQNLTDDASISALRAYNRAGLIITVNKDGSMTFKKGASAITDDSASFTGVATTTTMYDLREGKDVAITEIDVAKLKTKIEANYPQFLDDAKGLLYVYLANSTSSHPAAVRIVNGSATPGYESAKGFSVATNGGLYVKGDYNTATSSDGSGTYNPGVLMADSVTVLSSSWDDNVVTAKSGDSSSTIANKHDPSYTIDQRVANSSNPSATMTVAAGILTGNITEDASGNYVYSGGGHNLIRFLENWDQGTINFYGSFGRLFESTHFTGQYIQPITSPVYLVPGARYFKFNKALKDQRPPGALDNPSFSRGSFFVW